jgi:uncharacterized protein (TIGR03435 family)
MRLVLLWTILAAVHRSVRDQIPIMAVPQVPITPSPRTTDQPTTSIPTFESVWIRQIQSGIGTRTLTSQRGQIAATNVALRDTVRWAYQLEDFQIDAAAGDWINTDRSSVVATGADVPLPFAGRVSTIHLMLQAVLADRFTLVVHKEQREQPIYTLVLASTDDRLGPQLTPSTLRCGSPDPAESRGCGISGSPTALRGGAVALPRLASLLSTILQRWVVDRTGLSGTYDFELTLPLEPTGQSGRGLAALNRPSLFAATIDQLGLRLEAQRAPVEVLVIDKAQRAINN